MQAPASFSMSNEMTPSVAPCGCDHEHQPSCMGPCPSKVEQIFRYLFPVLIIVFATGTVWGPLYLPFVYTGFSLVYSLVFGAFTVTLALRYSKLGRVMREAHAKRITLPKTQLTHLILLPNHSESLQTLRRTLRALADHHLAPNYFVCLAMEKSEPLCEQKAQLLIEEFHKSFKQMFHTVHPVGLPGEAPGKASNVNWAARNCYERLVNQEGMDINQFAMTVADADSIFDERYFVYLDNALVKDGNNRNVLYAPPVLFNQNSMSENIPAIVRIADMQWTGCASGTFGLYDGVGFPLGVYSLPMVLAHRVGFWDTQASAMGEDMHMFLKCFFRTGGALHAGVVPYPVSQTNVEGDGVLSTLVERFSQAKRHAHGVQDTPYCWAQSTLCGSAMDGLGKLSAVIFIMFCAQFMPITNAVLLLSLNYLPYVQPLYQTPEMIVIWHLVNAFIAGSSILSLIITISAYQKTHNLISVPREQRSFKHWFVDICWGPIGAMVFLLIPTIRALVLLLYGSKRLGVYETARKPEAPSEQV